MRCSKTIGTHNVISLFVSKYKKIKSLSLTIYILLHVNNQFSFTDIQKAFVKKTWLPFIYTQFLTWK